jgi:S-adenosylhomocysteine hydrolase
MFPNLPVLDELSFYCSEQSKQILSQTVFVCVQHVLLTTGSLFKSLIELGVKPSNVFILGKCYSTNPEVLDELRDLGITVKAGRNPLKYGEYKYTMGKEIENLWKAVEEVKNSLPSNNLIIIDDGGGCINVLPPWASDYWPLVTAIEQTTSGLKPNGLFTRPLIEVASSAAKRLIESPVIAKAISEYICQFAAIQKSTKYGVVGYGNIGQAICQELYQKGYDVSIYDVNKDVEITPQISREPDIHSLIKENQFILGCTGEDTIPKPDAILRNISGAKTLASCSSGDREFNELLVYKQLFAQQEEEPINTMQDVKIIYPPHNNLELNILRGGFPVNFNPSKESEPALDIQLTRGLLLGAVIQATLYLDGPKHFSEKEPKIMLDPHIQKKIVIKWQETSSFQSKILDKFIDIEWIHNNSGGKYHEVSNPYSINTPDTFLSSIGQSFQPLQLACPATVEGGRF